MPEDVVIVSAARTPIGKLLIDFICMLYNLKNKCINNIKWKINVKLF